MNTIIMMILCQSDRIRLRIRCVLAGRQAGKLTNRQPVKRVLYIGKFPCANRLVNITPNIITEI